MYLDIMGKILTSFLLLSNNFKRKPMKKTVLTTFVVIICLVLLSHCGGSGSKGEAKSTDGSPATASEAAVPAIHKYGVKSGIVTFESSGFGLTVKKVLYFDDYGAREAEETYDDDGSLKETNLCDGKNMYILIHKDKTAFNRGNCYRGVAYKFDWNEAQQGGAEYKPTKLANQVIAGKDCETFSLEISGSKSVYAGWNNICFMIETPTGNGKVINKAIAFEENANVPDEKLSVPADYKVN